MKKYLIYAAIAAVVYFVFIRRAKGPSGPAPRSLDVNEMPL